MSIIEGPLWQGRIEIKRIQRSLWIGDLFIGEIVYDNRLKDTTPWRAELSTQKYLKTIGRYSSEAEAHGALLDAAVEAIMKE